MHIVGNSIGEFRKMTSGFTEYKEYRVLGENAYRLKRGGTGREKRWRQGGLGDMARLPTNILLMAQRVPFGAFGCFA